MKQIEKKRFTDRQLTTLILLIAFSVLLAVAITLGVILKNKNSSETNGSNETPELLPGESLQYNYPIAYPTMDESDITYVEVSGENGSYGLYRPEGGGSFELYYVDENGETNIYYPEIVFEDSSFSYDSLYAIETGDSFGTIPKLSYLCNALRTPYFNERIILSEDPEERNKQLKAYGFSEGGTVKLFFAYNEVQKDENGNIIKDEDGNTVTEECTHTVTLGKKDISGSGYYFKVDDRDYIYVSRTTYYDYAVSDFMSLIKPTLVAAGVDSDNGFGPYLTQGYYQWKTEQNKTPGAEVPENSKVIVFADVLSLPSGDDKAQSDGYLHTGYDVIEIDLAEFSSDEAYRNMIRALVGAKNGEYGSTNGEGNILFSIIRSASSNRIIDFGEDEKKTYSYSITSVESVFTENGEIFDTGYAVGENKILKIRYSVTKDGKTENTVSVIDLDSEAIPEDVKTALSAAKVGTLSSPIVFSVDYTKANASSRTGKYMITEILKIYDKDGKEISKVSSDSTVSYRYSFVINGSTQYEETITLDLSSADGDMDKKIRDALLENSAGANLDITVDEYTGYFEFVSDFTVYKIARIDYFVTSQLVAAFKFQNNSERDPYYGESLYENLMNNEKSLYGINYSSCQGIVRLLGGINADGESATAVGLMGGETVAVGLTPEVLDKYGLYAHRIRFVLPRGITAYVPDSGDETDEDTPSDYSFYDTITFTLYISDPDPVDGMRYIASDMYDIVTKVDGENFFFLDSDFASFWARRNIILLDIVNIDTLSVEFGYEDLYGKYLFDLGINTNDNLTVKVTPEGECTPNKLTEMIKEEELSYISLEQFYNTLYPDEAVEDKEEESTGSRRFRDALQVLYTIDYEVTLTEEEQALAFSQGTYLLRIELKINASAHKYVYEFYALDPSRVMVSLHKENSKGEIVVDRVSDFAISNFALKKLVKTAFFNLLDGEDIDAEVGYPDETVSK